MLGYPLHLSVITKPYDHPLLSFYALHTSSPPLSPPCQLFLIMCLNLSSHFSLLVDHTRRSVYTIRYVLEKIITIFSEFFFYIYFFSLFPVYVLFFCVVVSEQNCWGFKFFNLHLTSGCFFVFFLWVCSLRCSVFRGIINTY